MRNKILFLSTIILSSSIGCGFQEPVDHIDRNTERLADELEHDRQHLENVDRYLGVLSRQIERLTDRVVTLMDLAEPMAKALLADVGNKEAPPNFDELEEDEFVEDEESPLKKLKKEKDKQKKAAQS